MKMIDILLSLFFFIAVVIGFAISFLLLFAKKYHRSFYLGFFTLCLSLASFYSFYISGPFRNFSDLFIIAESFIFLAAPCSFLYVRNVISCNCDKRK